MDNIVVAVENQFSIEVAERLTERTHRTGSRTVDSQQMRDASFWNRLVNDLWIPTIGLRQDKTLYLPGGTLLRLEEYTVKGRFGVERHHRAEWIPGQRPLEQRYVQTA